MKNVRYDSISQGAQQPFTQNTHKWYNDMITESSLAIVQGLIPKALWDEHSVVILQGGKITTSGSVKTPEAGYIWYYGKIYAIDTTPVAINTLDVAVWDNDTSDCETNQSIVFTDGHPYPVLQEIKFKLFSRSTGHGKADETKVRRIEDILFHRSKDYYELITIPKNYDVVSGTSFLDYYFDSNGKGKKYRKYEGFALADGRTTGTTDMGGYTTIGANFANTAILDVRDSYVSGSNDSSLTYWASTISSIIGNVVGKRKHSLLSTESGLPAHSHSRDVPYDLADGVGLGQGSFTYAGQPTDGSTSFDSGGIVGGAQNASAAHENRQPSIISIMIQKVAELGV